MLDLTPPPGRAHLGVDVGGTKMLAAAYTTAGRRTWTFPTGPQVTADQLQTFLTAVQAELGDNVTWGLALPGLIAADGTLADCDVLPRLIGWNPQQAWGPAAVLNDGEAALVQAAAGEHADAAVAAIGCGTGLVAAFQIGGRRLRQQRPFAGELGFAPYGREGTYDAHAAGAALIQKLGMPPREIAAAVSRGDATAVDAVRSAGEAFGASIATVLHLLHPERIGLYGGTLRYEGYLTAAFETLQRISHPALLAQCRVEVMAEAELAVAHGALRAALAA
jgi:predicted NBD/HSP70 family sugar kinase